MIQQGLCTIFKLNLLKGLENLNFDSPYQYAIALYTAEANLGPDTTTYTPIGEVVGTGYEAVGKLITPIGLSSDNQTNTAYVSFENVTWDPAFFTARGALIYNNTNFTAVAVLDFGNDKTASGTFTVTFPASTSSDAIIRIS
jgi:hypothetical protein